MGLYVWGSKSYGFNFIISHLEFEDILFQFKKWNKFEDISSGLETYLIP
jgi:hypothetical protein